MPPDGDALLAKSESPDNSSAPPRRNFLIEVLALGVGGVLALVPLAIGSVVVFDPLFRRKKGNADFRRVATLAEIPSDGTPINVPVLAKKVDAWTLESGQPIGTIYLRRVGKNGQQVIAYTAVCPHAGCLIAYSDENSLFFCPCHDSSFALDGEKIDFPGRTNPSPRSMDTLEVDEDKVKQSGEVWVKFENYYPGKVEKVPKA